MQIKMRQGIGLLELMLSLVIIALLLIMATRYYAIVRTSQAVNEATSMVLNVYTAGENWLQSNDDFADVSVEKWVEDGALPNDFANENANPWGGNITVGPGEDGSQLEVTMSNIPQTACKNLLAKITTKLNDTTGECSENDPATLTLEMNMGE